MKVALKEICGPWDVGWVLDKHSLSSVPIGVYPNGRTQFDTKRTDVGEATYQLKYRTDWNQVMPLAQAMADNIYPKLDKVGLILPMPSTNVRVRQPVTEVAVALGELVKKPVFMRLLLKAANGKSLKDLHTKEEKSEAIGDSFSVHDEISNQGQWNVLIVDDLFHTGASMEAACTVLRTYPKIARIYVAALTWR